VPSGRIRGLPLAIGAVAALAALIVLITVGSPGGAGAAVKSAASPSAVKLGARASPGASPVRRPPAVPGAGEFYVGADVSPTRVSQFDDEAGIGQPAILGGYLPQNGQIDAVLSEVRNLPDTVPMVSWSVSFTRDFAFGSADDYIEQQALAVAAYGKPVFLRLNWEMNGTWEKQWSLPSVTTSQYIADWQHVVDIFRAVGADNAAFVWCPNAGRWNGLSPTDWYPGDAYVDWIGIDAYPRQSSGTDVRTESGGLNQLAAFAHKHGKPEMLAEWGVTSPDPDTARLFDLVFHWQAAYPDTVKALVYFDYVGTSGDHLLSDHPNGAAELKYLIGSHPGALSKGTAASAVRQ
jgi:Glycosyl hydrolase family 26